MVASGLNKLDGDDDDGDDDVDDGDVDYGDVGGEGVEQAESEGVDSFFAGSEGVDCV